MPFINGNFPIFHMFKNHHILLHKPSNFIQELKTYDEVIVTDISFGDLTLPNMKTFDYHGDLDKRCGTWQFYYNCVPKEKHTKSQNKFVYLVDVYDNWKISDPLCHSACLLNGFFLALTGSRYKELIHFQTINDSIWRDIFHEHHRSNWMTFNESNQ